MFVLGKMSQNTPGEKGPVRYVKAFAVAIEGGKVMLQLSEMFSTQSLTFKNRLQPKVAQTSNRQHTLFVP